MGKQNTLHDRVYHHAYLMKIEFEEVTRKPRIHFQDDVLTLRKVFVLIPSATNLKEWITTSILRRRHSIFRGKDGHLEAAGDSRRYGVAEVF